jgi:predicted MFS family arabinose efflux permease
VTSQLIAILRERPRLRAFFLGLLISRTGDFFNTVAISWLTLRIAGPRVLGLLFALAGIASAVAAPLGGYFLDRYGLRRMLFADNLARAVIAAILPVLLWTGHLTIIYLFVFTLASGMLGTITEMSQGIVMPLLAGEEGLDAANTLVSVIWEVSTWVGPALAGIIVEYAGMAPALVVDSATFALMAVVALAMPARISEDVTDAEEGKQGALAHMASGFSLIRASRPVTVTVTTVLCLLMLSGALEVFFPYYTQRTLHTGAAGYGWLVSIVGFGALVGALRGAPWLDRFKPSLAIGSVFALRLILLLPLIVVRNYAIAAILLGAGSVLDGSLTTLNRSVMQHQIPMKLRGRVFGAYRALTSAGFPLGSAAAGLLLAAGGPAVLLALAATMFLPVTVFVGRARLAKSDAYAGSA